MCIRYLFNKRLDSWRNRSIIIHVYRIKYICSIGKRMGSIRGGKSMKKYLLIAALAGLSLVACGGSKGSTEGTAKGGTLIMATNAEFPPYEYY